MGKKREMTKATISELGPRQVQVLLVGGSEQEFADVRELIAEGNNGHVPFRHAASPEDMRDRFEEGSYDCLLCSDKSPDTVAHQLLRYVRQHVSGIPLIFLSDPLNQNVIDTAIQTTAFRRPTEGSPPKRESTPVILNEASADSMARQDHDSEDVLRKLWRSVEQMADALIIMDNSGVMEYVNPAFEALTGYSRHEAIGQTLGMLNSDDQESALYDEMWNTVRSGNVFRGIVMNRKRNGETLIIEKALTPLRDGTGEITHFISTARDITERRKLESDLEQAHKMDAVGRLAGGVAHDFNNLLLVISAYAELMLDSLAETSPLRRNVGEITGMLPRLIGEDIELVFTPAKDLGKVKADAIQIEQVVMNLAANARDAMPAGGTLSIETAMVRVDESYVQRHAIVPSGDYVLLTVTDSGQGIAPEHMGHIFEPFYTTKEAGKGTGLGLATVYGIVKQNGGFVWVYSEPGLGTTFKVYLPQVQPLSREVSVIKLAELSPHGCETLLLVEDEASVRLASSQFLTRSGYTVVEASNGEEALRVSRAHPGQIDLMVTDVVMPKMGGPTLAQWLADERPNMKVLFVSGYAENTVLRHGKIDVATRFLQKPFSGKMLARKVREVLEGSEGRKLEPISSASGNSD